MPFFWNRGRGPGGLNIFLQYVKKLSAQDHLKPALLHFIATNYKKTAYSKYCFVRRTAQHILGILKLFALKRFTLIIVGIFPQ